MTERSRIKDWYTDKDGVVDYETMCDDLMPSVYTFRRWLGNRYDPDEMAMQRGCIEGHRDRDEGRVRG